MKKLVVAALCALGIASASAGQMDHWELGEDSTITDDEWTFNVNRRDVDGVLPGSTDVYGLQILECTYFPDHPATLDFSKPVVYTAGDKKYVITSIKPYGTCLPDDAKANIVRLLLPNHGLGLRISDAFQNCANLVSVEPFLPSDLGPARGMFQGCVKLASPLVYSGSSEFTGFWELFEGTAIPSADLSGSSITGIDRACFNKCKALKWVKLPPTLTKMEGGISPFSECTALELVEFNSVPSSLSAFWGCTALKEVRFNHTAPSGEIAAGIYNTLNQDITTYLLLNDYETDELEAWKGVSSNGNIDDASAWSKDYAGSDALVAKRPLRLYSAKSVSISAGQDGSFAEDRPGTFIVSRGDDDSLDGMVVVNYFIDGVSTAVEGIHIEPLSGMAIIPSGEKTGVIEVTPMYSDGTVTLTLRVAAGDYEIVDGADTATISIATKVTRSVEIAKGDDAEATSGQVGTFVISRGKDDPVGGALTVNYTIDASSTAEAGVHYEPLTGKATIPAGLRKSVIEVRPIYFGSVGSETLTLKLAEGDYELVPRKDSATITVATKTLRTVSIANGENAEEGTGKVGYFILSRGEKDSCALPLDVSLSVDGTATSGQTYRPVKSTVTIPAGETSTKVKVVPYDDPSVTEDTTVRVTISEGNYGIAGVRTATLTVVNGATYGGWKFVNGGDSISDGVWTFTVKRRANETFADGVHELWVQECTAWPQTLSTLDFGKAFHNFFDSTYYMISRLEYTFTTLGGSGYVSNSESAAVLGSLVLPDDSGYNFSIGEGCFKGCPNLTSVTPFLPRTCAVLGQNAFGSLPNLVQKDLCFYGSDFGAHEGCWGIIEGSTGITNVDLSASTVAALRRDCFKNCTGLKVVRLPPTIQEFGAPYDTVNPDVSNRSPFLGCSDVKLVFAGGALPAMTCNDGVVSAIEFESPVTELPDNAFYSYFNPYGSTSLTSITFVGEPPAIIGENLFIGENGGFKKESITVYVPNYYRDGWREIADGKVLSKTAGGTWTSGTTQILVTYGESKSGMKLVVR